MGYPMKQDYRVGNSLHAVPASDLTTVMRILNDITGANWGIDIEKTAGGRGWKLKLRVDDSTIELDSEKKLTVVAGSIGTTQLADSSVTTAKVADINITTGKLADSAATTAKITDLNVTTGKLANLAVATGKIAANAVTAAKMDTALYSDTDGHLMTPTTTIYVTRGVITNIT